MEANGSEIITQKIWSLAKISAEHIPDLNLLGNIQNNYLSTKQTSKTSAHSRKTSSLSAKQEKNSKWDMVMDRAKRKRLKQRLTKWNKRIRHKLRKLVKTKTFYWAVIIGG